MSCVGSDADRADDQSAAAPSGRPLQLEFDLEAERTPARVDPTGFDDPQVLALALSKRVQAAVRVRYSRSRSHAIQCERVRHADGTAFDLRLAAFFARAPRGVVDDLGTWLTSGRRARRAYARLMAWIDERWKELPARAIPASGRRTRGEHLDLALLTQQLASDPTAACLRDLEVWPTVGWGRWPTRPPKRGLQLGSFDAERHWVRIHPVLDSEAVPQWFVRFVLAHECLHALIHQNQWDADAHHGPKFRALEAQFANAARAEAWQAANTSALIKRVRAHLR